jgi:hypothetical protein
MAYGTDPGRALAILLSAKQPNVECRLLAKFLLRGVASRGFGHSTILGLCKAACHWEDLNLWLKTVSLCDSTEILDVLSTRRIVDAIEVFGFEAKMQDL